MLTSTFGSRPHTLLLLARRNRHELDFKTLEEQVDQVEKNLRDLAETVAKKLSLMVDLMVGLSDIVQTSRDGSKGG